MNTLMFTLQAIANRAKKFGHIVELHTLKTVVKSVKGAYP
jgi:hypothetical protein